MGWTHRPPSRAGLASHPSSRNGGTREAILRELWSRDQRTNASSASHLSPWPQRRGGDTDRPSGRERALRGGLSFIERALGVEKRASSGRPGGRSGHCRRASWRGGSRPMASRCRSLNIRMLGRGNATCCWRSRTCCTRWALPPSSNVARGATQGLNAPGSDMRWAAACRWTSPRCSRTCSRSSTRSRTTFSPQRVRDERSARWPELLGADYDTLALEIDATAASRAARACA